LAGSFWGIKNREYSEQARYFEYLLDHTPHTAQKDRASQILQLSGRSHDRPKSRTANVVQFRQIEHNVKGAVFDAPFAGSIEVVRALDVQAPNQLDDVGLPEHTSFDGHIRQFKIVD
jgi:hypothetical protein